MHSRTENRTSIRIALIKNFEKYDLRASKNKKSERDFLLINAYPAMFPKGCLGYF